MCLPERRRTSVTRLQAPVAQWGRKIQVRCTFCPRCSPYTLRTEVSFPIIRKVPPRRAGAARPGAGETSPKAESRARAVTNQRALLHRSRVLGIVLTGGGETGGSSQAGSAAPPVRAL